MSEPNRQHNVRTEHVAEDWFRCEFCRRFNVNPSWLKRVQIDGYSAPRMLCSSCMEPLYYLPDAATWKGLAAKPAH